MKKGRITAFAYNTSYLTRIFQSGRAVSASVVIKNEQRFHECDVKWEHFTSASPEHAHILGTLRSFLLTTFADTSLHAQVSLVFMKLTV